MWMCPHCNKSFLNRNNWHSCTVIPLDTHFAKYPETKKTFDALYAFVANLTSHKIKINVDKTRITFQIKTRFLSVNRITKNGLYIHLVTRSRLRCKRVFKVDAIPPNSYINHLRIASHDDLSPALAQLVRVSLEYGLGQSRLVGKVITRV